MSTHRSEWTRYGLAAALSALALAARGACSAVGGTDLTYSFHYLVIVVVTRFAGARAGLLAVALAHLGALVRFHARQPGLVEFQFNPWKFAIALPVSLSLVWVCQGFRRSARDAEELARRHAGAAKLTDEILAGMPDAYVAFDRDWRFTAVNPAAEQFFAKPAAELLGRVFWDVFPQLGDAEFRPTLLAVMRDRRGAELEMPSAIRPGRWIELRIVPTSAGLSIYLRDVTLRHNTNAALEAARAEVVHSEERYRTYVRQSTEAIWRCEADEPLPTGVPVDEQVDGLFGRAYVAECNDAMARMFGLGSADELVGARLRDLMPPVDPRNRAYLTAFVESGYRLSDVESHEVDLDGNAKVFVNNMVGVVEGGRLLRAWGTRRDVTEQRRTEAAIREGEQRLRTALDAGECGVWDWDVATGRVTWSERLYRFHGLRPGEFDGTREAFEALVHPEDRVRVGEAIATAIRERAPYHIEFRTVRPDGSVVWLSTSGAVTYDAGGRPLRMFGATIDTTARKRHEEERERLLASERAARADAERASRLKDEFLATVSHELRTPLNAILGWSQLLTATVRRAGGALSAELADDLGQGMETIERNARMQAQLVEDLLDMSRIISGKLRLNPESVDLPRVIAAAIEAVRPTADAKGIALQKSVEALPGDGVVRGDPQRLQQVVWNLLTNAIKFTPRGGRVGVSVRPAYADGHPSVEIEVADTGQGIPANFLAHAFERFRQADASSTRKHGGLGLGLSIVRHLTELHGGAVHAHSEGEGRGATFTVCLPVVAAAEAAMLSAARQPAAAPFQVELSAAGEGPSATQPLRGIKVLVVDDEADARDLLRRVLEDRDAHVATAGSAGEALELLGTFCPDVLLSDLGMPDQDGLAFIREVRARPPQEGGNVPAAAVTAFARAEDKDRALIAGYQAHVAKPVEPAHLVAAVAQLAAKREPWQGA